MLWVRVPSPTPDKTGDRGCPDSLFSFHIGASPSGKARDFDSLIRWFESSRPSQRFWCRPSAFDIWFDPIAQLAEQLPFKQWVRGSNPRRVTTSEQSPLCSDAFLCSCAKKRHPPAPLLLLSKSQPIALGCDLVSGADLEACPRNCSHFLRRSKRYIACSDFFTKVRARSFCRSSPFPPHSCLHRAVRCCCVVLRGRKVCFAATLFYVRAPNHAACGGKAIWQPKAVSGPFLILTMLPEMRRKMIIEEDGL